MKLILPDYYEDFSCLAGACKTSCCIGWALEVDRATLTHYERVPGEFGKKLRAELAKGSLRSQEGVCTLSLTVDGRCPFLDNENLCEIVTHLGPAALPEICSEYPRSYFAYGETLERTLLLSCEEAARLLFEKETPPTYPAREMEGDTGDQLSPEEGRLRDGILSAREEAFTLIASDLPLSISLHKIMERCLATEKAASGISQNDPAGDPLLFLYGKKTSPLQAFDAFLWRLSILSQLEVLNDDWALCLRDLNAAFPDAHSYDAALAVLEGAAPQREHDEKLFLNYLIFRNFPPAIFDGRLVDRMRYCVFSLLLLRDIDALLAQKNSGRFSFSDRITSVSLFSREIEHSDVNPEIILDELLFS